MRPPHSQVPSTPPRRTVELFCLPHAGGSSAMFRPWTRAATPGLVIRPVDYAGHGVRRGEPAATSLVSVVDDILGSCVPASGRPYAFFGHSMGAVIAYEVMVEIARRGGRLPCRAFLAAAAAPDPGTPFRSLLEASDAEILTELRRLGGTPTELMEQPGALAAALDLVRADSHVLSQARRRPVAPLPVPVTVMGGLGDAVVPVRSLGSWADCGVRDVTTQIFPGGHFLVDEHPAAVLAAVRHQLASDMDRPAGDPTASLVPA